MLFLKISIKSHLYRFKLDKIMKNRRSAFFYPCDSETSDNVEVKVADDRKR